MMLVLDANILIRAVLGSRVLCLLTKYSEQMDFFAPDVAFSDAREHLPGILEKLKIPDPLAMATLGALGELIQTVEPDTYATFESTARQCLVCRDEEDWPILAAAHALRCPIWMEDADFFGCGVAT